MSEKMVLLSLDDAIKKVLAGLEDCKVTGVFKYRNTGFLVVAVPNEGPAPDDPFYLVDRMTGKVEAFTPGYDMEGFEDALDHKVE